MCKEIVLDVHTLDPPVPFEIIMGKLTSLKVGEYIKVLHRMQAFPLYEVLLDNGFRYKVLEGEFGFDIYIWKASDKASAEKIKSFLRN